jgi:hypothetical protein
MIAADTLAMFIVDLFKSRRRVEVENLFPMSERLGSDCRPHQRPMRNRRVTLLPLPNSEGRSGHWRQSELSAV